MAPSRRLSPARAAQIGRRISRPPAHWSLLGFVALALMLMLLVHGLTEGSVGKSRPPVSGSDSLLEGRPPLLTAVGDRLLSRRLPIRRVALTFDDGPDPIWTPKIARELRRLHVPATFFVLGSHAVRHPGILRDLWQQGFEIGNHTFTHADVFGMPHRLLRLQVGATETAVAGAAGVRPRLFRPPYVSHAGELTRSQERTLARIARDGYVVVLSNRDGKDWDRTRSAADIARSAVGAKPGAGVILLHDGGGNRAATLAALPLIVGRLRANGFRLVNVSDLLRVRRSAVDIPATGWQRLRGRLLIAALTTTRWIASALTLMLGPIAVLILLRSAVMVALAHRHARRRRTLPRNASRPPSVSVVVPAFNEAVGIERAVRSFVASDYPELEVIVVDDGSDDGTAELVEALGLHLVRVIRQPNSGKSAALNHGIATSRNEVIVMVDADTVFEPGALRRVVAPLASPKVGAVSGNTKVGNRHGLLGRWQHIEYVIGFNLDRRLFDVLRCMPTVPGAIGAFSREALAEVWRQRYRWSYGTMQAIWKHKAAIWRRGDQRIGRRAIPYLVLFQILLPALAPLVDVFALYGILFLEPVPVIGYWLGFNLVQLAQAWYAFRLDGESPRPLWALPVQQFVYRQLMYLVVIESLISAMRGTRLRWQHVERTGEINVAS